MLEASDLFAVALGTVNLLSYQLLKLQARASLIAFDRLVNNNLVRLIRLRCAAHVTVAGSVVVVKR